MERVHIRLLAALLTALASAACAATAAGPVTDSRVAVIFVEPDEFTDAKETVSEAYSPQLLSNLERFIQAEGERVLPAGARLTVRITNLDIAGDFEQWRGPQFNGVRAQKGLYPPRIALEFRLDGPDGKIIKEGRRELTDIDYQLRSVYPKDDYLRYEKELLRDWFRSDLGAAR